MQRLLFFRNIYMVYYAVKTNVKRKENIMLNLLSNNKKRGVMILNSKECERISNNLFDCRVNTLCIDAYSEGLEVILKNIEHNKKFSKAELDMVIHYIKSIQEWTKINGKLIDESMETLS